MPLAHEIPDVRAGRIIMDAGTSTLLVTSLTRARATAIAPSATMVEVVISGTAEEDCGDEPAAAGDDLAYVIYTSGTSGTPKGVPITHDNVQPLLLWQREHFALKPGIRLAQTLSLGFDFGLQEILTTVLFGATLCIPTPGERVSAPAYAAFLEREGVNLLYVTPTFATQLAAQKVVVPSVETLVLGGELLIGAALRGLAKTFPGARIFVNGYGPTEASINCSMCFFHRAALDQAPNGALPVGRPTGLSRVAVVDSFGCLVPPGVMGEVVIGGAGVAAGYLNDPVLTQERFRPGPWPDRVWSYWTGDIGCLNADGSLSVLGRLDDQVKLRGYRIEPSEIEHVLYEHPSVAAAAVVTQSSGGRLQLRAFVVPTHSSCEAEDVRRFVAQRLPSAVVPSVELVAELSRNASGKLDRDALATYQLSHEQLPADRRRSEEVISQIWCELLEIDAVRRDDNFFDAGGYSLLVASVIDRIRAAFGLAELPVATLFEHPTIAELAAVVEAMSPRPGASDLAHVWRQRRRGRQPVRF